MKSHLLPYQAESTLWLEGVAKAFREFRKQRVRMICQAFEQEAEIPLFRKE